MQIVLTCPRCHVPSDHLLEWSPRNDTVVLRAVCLQCGASGGASMPLQVFHQAIGAPPSTDALETMTKTIRSAVFHAKGGKSSVLHSEGAWALIGVAIGVLLPFREWLGLDPKVCVIGLAAVVALDLFISTIILKGTFSIIPKSGWSIKRIVVLAQNQLSNIRRIAAHIAIFLIAKSMLLSGLLAGRVIGTYIIGYNALHLNG